MESSLLVDRLWALGQLTSATMDTLVWGCCREFAWGMESGEDRSLCAFVRLLRRN